MHVAIKLIRSWFELVRDWCNVKELLNWCKLTKTGYWKVCRLFRADGMCLSNEQCKFWWET